MQGCTAGFVVRSHSDNKPYILTAGHCVAEPIRFDGNKTAWYADMSAHPIGAGHNTSFFYSASHPAANGDAGIVNITYAADATGQWGPLHAWVMVRTGDAQPGGAPAPVDDFDYYIIDQVINQTSGDRVCMTGTTTGRTQCGKITGTGGSYDAGYSAVDGQQHHYVTGLVLANYCKAGGDSGAPVFAHS